MVQATGGGRSGTSQATVNVLNVAPIADFVATRSSLYLGQATTLTLSNPFDPSAADMAGLQYAIDCTGDGTPDGDVADPSRAVCVYPGVGTFFALGTIADDDGGSSSYSLTITVRSPQQGIQGLIAQVEGLVPVPLNPGQANSLIAKLGAAIRQLDKGNVTPAVNQLQAFINEVNAMVQSGKLDPATGAELIAAANGVIAALA